LQCVAVCDAVCCSSVLRCVAAVCCRFCFQLLSKNSHAHRKWVLYAVWVFCAVCVAACVVVCVVAKCVPVYGAVCGTVFVAVCVAYL